MANIHVKQTFIKSQNIPIIPESSPFPTNPFFSRTAFLVFFCHELILLILQLHRNENLTICILWFSASFTQHIVGS